MNKDLKLKIRKLKHLMKIGNWLLKIFGKILLPTKNLSKRNQKIAIGIALFVIIIMIPVIFYSLSHLGKAEAAWFNTNWGYRQTVPVSNSGTALQNAQIPISIDTATLITAGKMRSDCRDIRVTSTAGKALKLWVHQCNTATTRIYIWADSLPSGGSTFFLYYGNPSAGTNLEVETGTNQYPGISCKTVLDHNDSTGNATYQIDPNAGSPSDAFTAYCDMTTDSGGWTIVNSSNGAISQQGLTSDTEVTGNPFSNASSNLANQKKQDASLVSSESLFKRSTGVWLKASIPIFDGNLTTASQHPHTTNITLTANDATQVTTAVMGYSNYNNASGGDFGITTSAGFDHHSANYYHLNSGCVNHYLYKYGTTYNINTTLGSWTQTAACGNNSTAMGAWYAGMRGTITPIITNVTISSPTTEENGPAPVAYWKFDEGTGTSAKDSSSNKYNGTLGGPTLPSWKAESECASGNCLFFDSSNTANNPKVTLNESSTTKTNILGDVTISLWFKPVTGYNTTTQAILRNGNGADLVYSVFYDPTNQRPYFHWYDGAFGSVTASSNTAPLNKWTHVEIVRSGTNLSFYINGKLDKTLTVTAPTVPAGQLSIGQTNNDAVGQDYHGFIDDVKIYSYARSAAQVKVDYNSRGGSGGNVLGAEDNKALSQGLVGHWKMDESSWNGTSGEMLDSSGNNNNGTTYGNAIATPSAKFGNGGYFDGNNDTATISAATSLDFTATGEYSFGLWINPAYISNSANGTSLIAKTNTGNGWDFHITSNGTLGVYFPGSSNCTFGGSCYSTTILPTSQWSHIIFTYNSGVFNLYLNGILIKSATVNGAISNTGNSIYFSPGNAACSGMFSCAYKGTMDEVRMYNRDLSPSEVSQLYNFAPGPITYYNFEEGSFNGSVIDSSGNGLAGTVTGITNSTGKYGKGAKFNGTSNNIVTTDNATLRIAAYSVSVWIKPEVNNVYWTGIIGKPGRNFNIWFGNSDTSTGYIHHRFHDTASWNSGCPDSSGVPIDGKTWTYVTITNDGTTCKTYFNGVLQQQGSVTGSLVIDNSNIQIGTSLDGGGSGYFKGNMDEVKIYNYARTAKQIVSDMNANHPSVGSPIGSAVGYWKFDEGQGTTTHNSGRLKSALDGTITAALWKNDGKFGKALSYDGNTSNVTTPTFTYESSQQYTLSAWIKDVGSGQTTYLSKATSWSNGFRFWGGLSALYFRAGDGTNAVDLFSGVNTGISTNNWFYLTMIRNGSTWYLYINGKLKSTATNTTIGDTNNSAGLIIGAYNAWDPEFKGMIDEVKIYNYALTADEVKLDMNHGASQVLGSMSDTSSLTGGSVASNSASAAYCIPGDTTSCAAPVGEWNFEEGQGGTAFDSSGNGNNAVITAATYSKGKAGKGLSFNGSTAYATASDLDFTNAMTGELWAKFDSVATQQMMIRAGPATLEYQIQMQGPSNSQKFRIRVDSAGGSDIVDSITQAVPNKWYHIAWIYDGTDIKFYINGIEETVYITNTGSGNITDSSESLTIGAYSATPDYPTNGTLDNIRIFNYARTPAQVAWDYNRGAPVGWWKFDECQGITANDSSGNGNSGTITIGATGTQTSVGTCTTASTAWGNGATGKYNASLNFDGTDDYISAGNGSSLNLGSADFTASAWIYTTSTDKKFFLQRSDLNDGWLIGVNCSSNTICLEVRENGTTNSGEINYSTTIQTNTWYHITVVKIGVNITVYKNGLLVGTQTAYQNLSNSSVNFKIGLVDWWGPGYFQGKIDDVRIYNYALTKQQIQQVMNQGAAVRFGPSTGTP